MPQVVRLSGMHSAKDYRERAAQARRLAHGVTDREVADQLQALAREYDAIADRIEQMSAEIPPEPEEPSD